MAITRTKGLSVFAILGVAGLILTGCSSSDESAGSDSGNASSSAPAAEEQSVEEACTMLTDGVMEMQTSITDSMSELQTDPAAASAAFQEVIGLFQENAAKVTNEDVKPAADKISAVFATLGETMDQVATDPQSVDPEAMTTYTTDLQAATTELTEACGTM